MPTQPLSAALKPERLKLIFNPAAGVPEESPFQLSELLTLLQIWQFLPEVHIVTSESDLDAVVAEALKDGIRIIAVAGGDGTIESAMCPLVGSRALLGIIPTGTRNNVAFSLGVPLGMAEAVEVLRTGRKARIDVGYAECGEQGRWFLETTSIGLAPALYPAADDIQHGNIMRIADFLGTLVTSQPVHLRLEMDGNRTVESSGLLALATNMPYFGANFQVSPDVSYADNRLDVFLFPDLTKLDLMGYAVQIASRGVSDPRVQHYRVRRVSMQATPSAPVMADGFSLGVGTLTAWVRHQGLNVIVPALPPAPGSPNGL